MADRECGLGEAGGVLKLENEEAEGGFFHWPSTTSILVMPEKEEEGDRTLVGDSGSSEPSGKLDSVGMEVDRGVR